MKKILIVGNRQVELALLLSKVASVFKKNFAIANLLDNDELQVLTGSDGSNVYNFGDTVISKSVSGVHDNDTDVCIILADDESKIKIDEVSECVIATDMFLHSAKMLKKHFPNFFAMYADERMNKKKKTTKKPEKKKGKKDGAILVEDTEEETISIVQNHVHMSVVILDHFVSKYTTKAIFRELGISISKEDIYEIKRSDEDLEQRVELELNGNIKPKKLSADMRLTLASLYLQCDAEVTAKAIKKNLSVNI